MILIFCVDDKGGLLFNHRRQSKDRVLRERVLGYSADSRLWMNTYTKGQFEETAPQIAVDESFLSRAGKGEYCFLETDDPATALPQAEKVVLYRWNRHYPADRHFTFDWNGWKKVSAADFAGSSHENITEEVYER